MNEKSIKLNKGKIAIFPTDTAFGIGCRIDDVETVERLFNIRKRPHDKAVPVLVSSYEMAKSYGIFDKKTEEVAKKFWPGGLTLVVKAKKEKVPSLVRGGGDTIGLRMPHHALLLKIIEKTGVPILGPSANFAGDPTPYTLMDVNENLKEMVNVVFEGKTKAGVASTVLDTTSTPWKILREGAVPESEIKKTF